MAKVGASTSVKGRQKIPRLNQLDLQALFRRLDVNGNGDLSFAEFRHIVTKLNLTSPSVIDCIHDVYKAADTDPGGGGSLNLVEFMKAYDILYNRLVNDTGVYKEEDPLANFVRATRYGYFGREGSDKRYIFECYTGSMSNITTKYVYDLPNVEDNDGDEIVVPDPIDISDIPYKTVALDGYSVETINRLILEDSDRNLHYDARMMWWVDICSKKLKESEITAAMNAFGIPAEIRDKISVMDDDEKIHFGQGEVVCESIGKSISSQAYVGKSSMLSFFTQSMYLQNKAVVDRDSDFMRSIPFDLGKYFNSRMALFYNYSKTRCYEKENVMSSVQKDISCLLDNHLDDRKRIIVEEGRSSKEDVLSSPHQTSLTLPEIVQMQGDSFLLSFSDMKTRPPSIVRENVSLHIQDQGNGPIALITIRAFDSNDPNFNMDQNSRSGIVGRIMSGIWLKLLEVTANEGVVNKASDLDDSSFSLAITIISMIHNTSMLTTQSLDLWMKQLAAEIEEVAVTKHAKHIEKLDLLLQELRTYVSIFNETFHPLVEAFLVATGAEDEVKRAKPSRISRTVSSATFSPAIIRPQSANKGVNVTRKPLWKPGTILEISVDAPINPHRKNGEMVLQASKDLKSVYPYEETFNFKKTSTEQRLRLLRDFACHDTVRRLPELLNGVDSMELKGGVYWLERIEALEDYLQIVNTRYRLGLDEKRNFWAFTLGIVSIATFPFAVMTGYFGMNFENMAEPGGVLTDEYWPMFPGQYLIWILTLIVYSAMGLVALHYQVFYSAT